MDITCDQYCDMGYIYLLSEYRDQQNNFKLNQKLENPESEEEMANIILRLNKLNWPDKLYKNAVDKDFIEEFQNDLNQKGYMKGIELKLPQDRLKRLIDNLSIKKFQFDEKNYFLIPFDTEDMIFSKNNYVFAFTEKEDAYVITSKTGEKMYRINIDSDSSPTSAGPKPVQIKALIFSEDSPYNIEYFRQLKIYKV